MQFVIVSTELGVFVGYALGLAFWTNLETAGQIEAVTFENPIQAYQFSQTWDNQMDDLSFVPVPNGHWRTLAQRGLPTADMADNEAIAQYA